MSAHHDIAIDALLADRPAPDTRGESHPTTGIKAALISTRARLLAHLAHISHHPCLVFDCAPPPRGRATLHHWLQTDHTAAAGEVEFNGAELVRRLAGLPPQWQGLPVMLGAGFDHRPELATRIARSHRLLGNDPDTLAMVSEPESFQEIVSHLKLPHVPVSDSPHGAGEWLTRHVNDEYDRHTLAATLDCSDALTRYYQRKLPGRRMLAIFAANGQSARVLGVGEYLMQGEVRIGAIGPLPLPPAIAKAISRAVGRFAAELGLLGLNRLDFILNDQGWFIERLTGRLTDEIALFEGIAGQGVLALHLAAIEGALPDVAPATEHSVLNGISRVIAPRPILVGRTPFADWVLDPPAPGQVINRGETLCTVQASGTSQDELRATLRLRGERLVRAAPSISM
ncbi:MAG: hypothetical protein RIR70_310 [Pseudomonadota bacterium]|jgi:hypothetical protein